MSKQNGTDGSLDLNAREMMSDRDFVCNEHSGHEARIANLEKGEVAMESGITSAHRRIDGMKNWVIAGMTSLVIQLILFIGSVVLVYIRTKP